MTSITSSCGGRSVTGVGGEKRKILEREAVESLVAARLLCSEFSHHRLLEKQDNLIQFVIQIKLTDRWSEEPFILTCHFEQC